MQQELIQLLCDLIHIESETPYDHGCQKLLKKELKTIGFDTVSYDSPPVSNLWAELGDSDGPLFVFAGHTDVVPAGNLSLWHTPPYQPTIIDNKLYGRGACDMKGSIAAMIIACKRLLARKTIKGKIGFLITSGEEGDHYQLGTPHVMEILDDKNIKINYCLVGEPSSHKQVGDVVKIGRRGSLNATIVIEGIQGHVAYPDLAKNPIHEASGFIHDVTHYQFDKGNAFFPPTSFQISDLHAGNGSSNVIPNELKLRCNFRYSTETTHQQLIKIVEGLLFDKHKLKAQIEWTLSGPPFLTSGGKLLKASQKSIKDLCYIEPELSTSGGTSDGRFIAPYGVEVIELGPCNDSIHQINEYTDIEQLVTLSRVYEQIIEMLLCDVR